MRCLDMYLGSVWIWNLHMKMGLVCCIDKYDSTVDTFTKSTVILGKLQTKHALSITTTLLLRNSAYIKTAPKIAWVYRCQTELSSNLHNLKQTLYVKMFVQTPYPL